MKKIIKRIFKLIAIGGLIIVPFTMGKSCSNSEIAKSELNTSKLMDKKESQRVVANNYITGTHGNWVIGITDKSDEGYETPNQINSAMQMQLVLYNESIVLNGNNNNYTGLTWSYTGDLMYTIKGNYYNNSDVFTSNFTFSYTYNFVAPYTPSNKSLARCDFNLQVSNANPVTMSFEGVTDTALKIRLSFTAKLAEIYTTTQDPEEFFPHDVFNNTYEIPLFDNNQPIKPSNNDTAFLLSGSEHDELIYPQIRANLYSRVFLQDFYVLSNQETYDSGYGNGYNDGYRSGVNKQLVFPDVINGIFESISNVLNVEIFPSVKLWYIIGVPLILGVIAFIIGFFRGGS